MLIVKVEISDIEWLILGYGIHLKLAMFLALDK